MRLLLSVIVIAAAAWSGYWFVGSTGLHAATDSWFNARRSEGWAADYTDMQVRGFPNRFDTVFTDIALADPDTGLAWGAPMFQMNTLSYRPNHIIAVWPDKQRIATPLQKYDITSTGMRASLIVSAAAQLPLERSTLTAESLAVTALGSGDTARLSALTLAVERAPQTVATYRLGLRADGLVPSLPWKARVDPRGTLPDRLETLSADVTATFDKAWDMTAIEDARPQPQAIRVRLAEARWGQLELQAAGELDIGPDGVPEGEITIKARNWRDILALAVASGALPEGLAQSVEDGLSLIAQLAGNPKTLDIPLGFRNGRITLGPVPISAAPVLRFR